MSVSYSFHSKVLYGKVSEDVREIFSILCRYKNEDIIAGAVCTDHVHLSVAIPPKFSISNFMGVLEGESTLMIYDRHPELQSKWDKAFWARGYYVETIGNITDEAVHILKSKSKNQGIKQDSFETYPYFDGIMEATGRNYNVNGIGVKA